jgi:4-hydroxybenzoate polyprenyltransferase
MENKTLLRKIAQKWSHFSELVMFQHSVFSFPFIFIAMLVASYHENGSGWFGWRLLFLGVIAAVSARNYAMGVNRYLDRDIDSLNPRTKGRPSVDGRVSSAEIRFFIVVNALVFVATSYFVNLLALQLSIPILFILGGYTFFKRFSSMAHLILGVSLGLAPIAGVVAVQGEITQWSLMLAVGVMFWVAGFDLLYSLQDMAFDQANGLHSIPSKFGPQRTMWIARFFHVMAVVFWIFFVFQANLGMWANVALFISGGMLGYEHYLVNKDFTKIDKAFFTVNGYLGFIFLFFIIVEVI